MLTDAPQMNNIKACYKHLPKSELNLGHLQSSVVHQIEESSTF